MNDVELIDAYLDGRLDEAGIQQLKDSLDQNSELLELLEKHQSLHQALQILNQPAEANQRITNSVQNILRSKTPEELQKRISKTLQANEEIKKLRLTPRQSSQYFPSDSPQRGFLQKGPRRNQQSRAWLALASCITILAGIFFYIKLNLPRNGAELTGVEPIGVVDHVTAKATIKRNNTILPARTGAQILAGDILTTETGSTLVLVYHNEETRVWLEEKTQATFLQTNLIKQVNIAKGKITATVAKQPVEREMIFETFNSVITVMGTRLDINVSEGRTRLDVMEGKVQMTRNSDRISIIVETGYSAEISSKVDFKSHLTTIQPPPQTRLESPSQAPVVTHFVLVDATSGQSVSSFDPIQNETTISLSKEPQHLNIVAVTQPQEIGYVLMKMKGPTTRVHREFIPPYSLFQDIDSNYRSWTPIPGKYTLTATPYSTDEIAGKPLTISFTVTP
jgi:hypothetical protein